MCRSIYRIYILQRSGGYNYDTNEPLKKRQILHFLNLVINKIGALTCRGKTHLSLPYICGAEVRGILSYLHAFKNV